LVLYRETIAVYSQNHKKHIKMIYGQNAELVNFRTVGTYRFLTTGPRNVTAEIPSAESNGYWTVHHCNS